MIYCAYCGSYNVHTLECIKLRADDPATCPDCKRGNLLQMHNTPWWECDHCTFVGHDPRFKKPKGR